MPKVNMTASPLFPHRPLCCRYLLAALFDVSMIVIETGGGRERLVRWGLGMLSDGQQEFLGAWSEPVSTATVWQAIADDLKICGVERIRFVAGPDPAGIESAMHEAFPGVAALPAIGHLLPRKEDEEPLGSMDSLSTRHRRLLRHAGDTANHLRRRLKQAVIRHGCFPNLATATSFVFDTLAQAERDLGSYWVDGIAGRASPTARPIAWPGIAAPSA